MWREKWSGGVAARREQELAGGPGMAERGQDMLDGPAEPERGKEVKVGGTGTPGRRFKVLLVEDDEDFRFYLKDNLAPLFTVLEAANGREGWQKTLSAQPDLVISDVNMPLMDGLELSRKIKADERVRHIPVVLLTALSGEQEQLKALGMGVNDYLSKPFNVEILISRIRNLLDFRGSVEETLKKKGCSRAGGSGIGAGEDGGRFCAGGGGCAGKEYCQRGIFG
ncbi:response regulator [Puia sp. P3]|uniref:response regulator n=1 Tax=Puia sp. P3 TaxID=3423952 RepID=UPI003D674D2F